jgi:peptidoglycan/LPS O-acetylase OafA/YrhL
VVVVIACLPGAVPQQVAREEGLVALWFLSALLVAFASLDRGYVLPIPVLAPVLQYLGSRSLPLYLAMVPVGRLEDDLGGRWPRYRALVPEDAHHPLVRTLVLLATTILVAEVVHRCVEQPFRRIARARSPVG